MHDYQRQFIEFALDNNVLCFGDFTLKSGRQSPYFFNSGLFNSGKALARLGYFYARTINSSGIDFNILFGPAYKGIPLGSATAIALAEHFETDVPYCFNRKEIKDHGEGGLTLGAPLGGKVLIIDDVISAGTSLNNSIDLIETFGATAVALVIAMDRQEKGSGKLSAVQEAEQLHKIKVLSIINLENIIEYLQDLPKMKENLHNILEYNEKYGVYIPG